MVNEAHRVIVAQISNGLHFLCTDQDNPKLDIQYSLCLSCVRSNEPGPDFADYPYDTVPNKVDQLFRAQRHHDRRQNEVSVPNQQ